MILIHQKCLVDATEDQNFQTEVLYESCERSGDKLHHLLYFSWRKKSGWYRNVNDPDDGPNCIFIIYASFWCNHRSGRLLSRLVLLSFIPNDKPFCRVCNYCNKPSVLARIQMMRAFREKKKKENMTLMMASRSSHSKATRPRGSPLREDIFSLHLPPFHVLSLFSVIDCFMPDIKSNAWPTKRIIGRFD